MRSWFSTLIFPNVVDSSTNRSIDQKSTIADVFVYTKEWFLTSQLIHAIRVLAVTSTGFMLASEGSESGVRWSKTGCKAYDLAARNKDLAERTSQIPIASEKLGLLLCKLLTSNSEDRRVQLETKKQMHCEKCRTVYLLDLTVAHDLCFPKIAIDRYMDKLIPDLPLQLRRNAQTISLLLQVPLSGRLGPGAAAAGLTT